MLISMVVAMSRNGVIGKDGALPWSLPRDLKRFRELTWGKPIVMGRKTHESLGRPLPGRPNLILTRQTDFKADGCLVVHTVDEALKTAASLDPNHLVVIGGRSVYEAFLPLCGMVHLTVVEGEFKGDTEFPVNFLDSPDWKVVWHEDWPADARNAYDANYFVLSRRNHTAT